MSLAAKLRESFSSTIVTHGERYFAAGRVRITHTGKMHIETRVAGSRKAPYAVVVRGSKRRGSDLDVRCSCPSYSSGTMCKHIWASLVCIDAADPPVWPERVSRREALRALEEDAASWRAHDGDDDDLDSVDVDIEPGDLRSPSEHGDAAAADLPGDDSATTWKRQLEGVETYNRSAGEASGPGSSDAETWYALNMPETRHNGVITIDLRYRRRKKDGELGKMKSLNVSSRGLPGGLDDVDVEMIEVLSGNRLTPATHYEYYSQPSFSRVEISPAMHAIALPRLCATGRFVQLDDDGGTMDDVVDSEPLAWDGGEPWKFRMSIDSDDADECWRFAGYIERGEESLPLSNADAVLATGLVVFPGRVARLEVGSEFAWVLFMRGKAGITIPYADRNAFLGAIYSMSELPPVELPPGLAVERDGKEAEERDTPRGRVRVQSADTRHGGFRNTLFAEVAFVYGDEAFSLRDKGVGRYVPGTERAVVRDPDSERALTTQLRDLGLKPPAMSSYFREEFDFYFHQGQLSEIVGTLGASGWMVEADGVRIRRPGPLSLSVTSGVDWFELDGRVDFGGASASLPALLEAVRRKESFVRLDDGSQGIVPSDWMDQYGHLARLGSAGEDCLRFSRSQALLLDALLAEQEDVRVDRGFEEFRRKLASFDGIKPRGEPRGFSGELRDYQKDGHGWLHFLREFGFGGCLADDMGLGKTIQVLALLQARHSRRLEDGEERRPSLVVVPKSLVFNWIDEAKSFTPGLKLLDYTGMDRETRRLAATEGDGYDVMITTYGTLRREITRLRDIRFDYAILDESQAIKNSSSQAAKASRLLDADNRLAMTGTPVENHLGELWSLFEFLNPGLLGNSSVFEALRKHGGDEEGMRGMLSSALRPFLLRRTKKEVLSELPEKTEQTLHCELSTEERAAYEELREYYRTSLAERIERDGINKSRVHVLEALLRLRQASCHRGLLDPESKGEHSAKLETLLTHVEEVIDEGHKALVFSQFTSLLAIVREELDRRGVVYEYLDGRTRNRAERVKRFQEDAECPLFLISLKAGGQGLNLTAADYVYILDPWWNPAVEAQAVDRAHRIGQDRHVFAYRLIAKDTVEEKIVELQNSKRALADAIVAGDAGPIAKLSAEDVELLLR